MNDLYRMFDRAGRLLYVGISFNAGERATQHAETKPWWPQVDLTTSNTTTAGMTCQHVRPL